MLRSLTIRNFKRFRELSFPELKRVNLLAGKNNTGKTGVLEALFLLFAPEETHPLPGERPQPRDLPSVFRRSPSFSKPEADYWRWLVRGADPDGIASAMGRWMDGPDQGFFISRSSDPPVGFRHGGRSGQLYEQLCLGDMFKQGLESPRMEPYPLRQLGAVPLSAFPADLVESRKNYDKVVLMQDGEERIEALLAKIEPRLKGIRSLEPYGTKLLYVDVGLPEKIPATHLGEGFNRLLSMYCQLIASGKRVMLIDEFENGLHYSTLTEVWRGVAHLAAQENIQVFATTHSYECIRAAHEAFAETPDYDFALHRLEDLNGEINVTTYTKETLRISLESNFEIR